MKSDVRIVHSIYYSYLLLGKQSEFSSSLKNQWNQMHISLREFRLEKKFPKRSTQLNEFLIEIWSPRPSPILPPKPTQNIRIDIWISCPCFRSKIRHAKPLYKVSTNITKSKDFTIIHYNRCPWRNYFVGMWVQLQEI